MTARIIEAVFYGCVPLFIREYGDNTIRKWCKIVNLPYRTTDIKQYTNEEWEKI